MMLDKRRLKLIIALLALAGTAITAYYDHKNKSAPQIKVHDATTQGDHSPIYVGSSPK